MSLKYFFNVNYIRESVEEIFYLIIITKNINSTKSISFATRNAYKLFTNSLSLHFELKLKSFK